jgi:hypothetical protein
MPPLVFGVNMGTKFFQPRAPGLGGNGNVPGANINMQARAGNAPIYAQRSFAAGDNKDIGAAAALDRAKVEPLKFLPGGKK